MLCMYVCVLCMYVCVLCMYVGVLCMYVCVLCMYVCMCVVYVCMCVMYVCVSVRENHFSSLLHRNNPLSPTLTCQHLLCPSGAVRLSGEEGFLYKLVVSHPAE